MKPRVAGFAKDNNGSTASSWKTSHDSHIYRLAAQKAYEMLRVPTNFTASTEGPSNCFQVMPIVYDLGLLNASESSSAGDPLNINLSSVRALHDKAGIGFEWSFEGKPERQCVMRFTTSSSERSISEQSRSKLGFDNAANLSYRLLQSWNSVHGLQGTANPVTKMSNHQLFTKTPIDHRENARKRIRPRQAPTPTSSAVANAESAWLENTILNDPAFRGAIAATRMERVRMGMLALLNLIIIVLANPSKVFNSLGPL